MFTLKGISVIFIVCFLSYLLVVCTSSCEGYHRNKSYAHIPLSSIEKGEVLARTYCQSCHSFPEPKMLDARTWEKGVLPQMGPRLGIFVHHFESYPSSRYDQYLDSGFYPEKPLLPASDWQHIIDYYTATAPDSLPAQQRKLPITVGLPLFALQAPSYTYENALTSFIKINPGYGLPPLVVSDVQRQQTFLFDEQLQIVDSISNRGALVDINFRQNEMLTCDIGNLNPTNGKFGKIRFIRSDASGQWLTDSSSLADSLSRPVQLMAADLNNDKREDYLVCEFGYLTGSLSWLENRGGGQYKRHVLRPLPGAVKAYLQDYNKDGNLDIWVLFAQGEEGVFLFTNQGDGRFHQEQVLRFPSVYGSSYFELADFNNDDYPDIVYTCGDNADYSTILKPYHGVYIFLNDKGNQFKQRFFFPMNGCYKAMARDFDNDGDPDIAAIAYFPDFTRQPEEGFVYLENRGGFDFYPYSFPEAQVGRWLTMDAGDLDGDGRLDIVLGNFCMGPSITRSKYDWRKGPPFVVLKNRGKKTTN